MQRVRHTEKEFRRRFDAGVWRKLFRLLKPYRRQYLKLLGVVIMLAGVEASFPLVVRYAVDHGITTHNRTEIYRAVAVYTGLIAAQAFLVWAFIAGCGRVGARVMSDFRSRTFNHLQRLSVSYFNDTPVGWIMSRMMSDSQRVGETISWGAVDFVWGFIMMTFMAVAMLVINWKLALAVLGLIPIILMVSVRFQRLILAMYRKVRKINSEITAGYNEGVTGVRVIKSLCREDAVSGEFSELTDNMFRASFRSAVLASMYLPIIHVIGTVGSALVVGLGGNGVITGGITMGTLVAFISYTRRFFDPANEIARVFGQLQEAQASAERIFSLLETEPDIVDVPNALSSGRITGRVEFRDVTFSYDGSNTVLENFNLDVEPGRIIALVGPTGGGKTTVTNLLMRFFDVNKGQVRVDGTDIREMQLKWLRSQMSVVLQTPSLFTGPLRENIRYGRLDATDDDIVEAARAVGAHEFIMAFPDGYDTHIRENGEPLSTGQKQLVSLARAILADPAIFIMDEATSSVDIETEARIQQATESMLRGRTSFIIAHRLTTIRQADRILVIEGGRIIESGTHMELLDLNGHYSDLYRRQFMVEPVTA